MIRWLLGIHDGLGVQDGFVGFRSWYVSHPSNNKLIMMIRAAAVSAMLSRSHQHMAMAHDVTSNGQALLRTWQHHHSVSLSMVSKVARLALGCSEVVEFAWVSVSEILLDCFWCLFLQSSGLCLTHCPHSLVSLFW